MRQMTAQCNYNDHEFNKEDKHCKHCGKPRSVYDKPQFTFTHEDVKKLHPTTYLYEEEE